MPPLSPEPFKKPEPNEMERQMMESIEVLKGRTKVLMLSIPFERTGRLFRSHVAMSKAAIYKAENQPPDQHTKAWLELVGDENRGFINLYTQPVYRVGEHWKGVDEPLPRYRLRDDDLLAYQKDMSSHLPIEQQVQIWQSVYDTVEEIAAVSGIGIASDTVEAENQ